MGTLRATDLEIGSWVRLRALVTRLDPSAGEVTFRVDGVGFPTTTPAEIFEHHGPLEAGSRYEFLGRVTRTDELRNMVTVDIGGRAPVTLRADFIIALEGHERGPLNEP